MRTNPSNDATKESGRRSRSVAQKALNKANAADGGVKMDIKATLSTEVAEALKYFMNALPKETFDLFFNSLLSASGIVKLANKNKDSEASK